jgi:hypothetical protein
MQDEHGRRLVTVHGYGFAWSGTEPLKVGDHVLLPPSAYSPNGWYGHVQHLGSSWPKGHAEVVRRLSEKDAALTEN